MNVRYNLLKKKNTSYILLCISYDGKRLQTSINEKIDPNKWSKLKQRVKISCTEAFNINSYLDKIEAIAKKIYYKCKMEGYSPTTDGLKEMIFSKLNGSNKKLSFYEFVEEFTELSKNTKKKETIDDYNYTIKSLKEFEKYKRRRIDWDTLDMKFYDAYMDYQYNVKGNSQNLFGKRIKHIKTFLNAAYESGNNKHLMYKGFKRLQFDTDTIYLNEQEIDKMYMLDLSKNKRLERIRDLFIVECLTGVRYGDLMKITKEYIFKDSIKIKVSKTGQVLHTLLLPTTKKILKKYNFILPKISNSNYNKYIKEVGKIAGINQTLTQESYRSGKAVSFKRKKYQLITTHTARRSFATNMYKRGYSPVQIMSITGHKKESTFLTYIRITNEESVRMISLDYKKKVG
jgi:integrase